MPRTVSNACNDEPVKIVLTHDVDWPPEGPNIEHILARRDRFSEEIISKTIREGDKPYFGIPEIMCVEERYNFRSTFFFRYKYDNGTLIDAYKEILGDLFKSRWEIGVHINEAGNLNSILSEKRAVEDILGAKVYGSRVHNLKINIKDLSLLHQAGFKYDSSINFNKYDIDARNTGYFNVGGIVEFPITIMDTYLFTYMKITEEKVVDCISKALNIGAKNKFITILWHDCSIKMVGGRMYPKIIEFLHSKDYLEVVRMIDAYRMIVGEKI
jgi:peptidoglycan/xylan/chitin deacetylase (PgdA/CDA1 family)